MATRPCTVTKSEDGNTVKFAWDTLTTTNADGVPIDPRWSDYPDRTVQVIGTFGTNGSLRIEGSLDGGTTYAALNDPFGTGLNVTAAGIKGITEVPLLTRPNLTAGDGSTDIDVFIIARRARSGKAV